MMKDKVMNLGVGTLEDFELEVTVLKDKLF